MALKKIRGLLSDLERMQTDFRDADAFGSALHGLFLDVQIDHKDVEGWVIASAKSGRNVLQEAIRDPVGRGAGANPKLVGRLSVAVFLAGFGVEPPADDKRLSVANGDVAWNELVWQDPNEWDLRTEFDFLRLALSWLTFVVTMAEEVATTTLNILTKQRKSSGQLPRKPDASAIFDHVMAEVSVDLARGECSTVNDALAERCALRINLHDALAEGLTGLTHRFREIQEERAQAKGKQAIDLDRQLRLLTALEAEVKRYKLAWWRFAEPDATDGARNIVEETAYSRVYDGAFEAISSSLEPEQAKGVTDALIGAIATMTPAKNLLPQQHAADMVDVEHSGLTILDEPRHTAAGDALPTRGEQLTYEPASNVRTWRAGRAALDDPTARAAVGVMDLLRACQEDPEDWLGNYIGAPPGADSFSSLYAVLFPVYDKYYRNDFQHGANNRQQRVHELRETVLPKVQTNDG